QVVAKYLDLDFEFDPPLNREKEVSCAEKEAEVLVPTVSELALEGAEVFVSSAKVPAPMGVKASVSPTEVLASTIPSTSTIVYIPPVLPELPKALVDSTSVAIPEIPELPGLPKILNLTESI
ncbi:unnamed protein product, partial [Ilex paraguariensis]